MLDLVTILGLTSVSSLILICGFIGQRCLLLELNIVGSKSKSRPILILNFIAVFRLVFSWVVDIDIANILVGCH